MEFVLNKKREFGDLLGDAFRFYLKYAKELILGFIVVTLPIAFLYAYTYVGFLQNLLANAQSSQQDPMMFFSGMFPVMAVGVLQAMAPVAIVVALGMLLNDRERNGEGSEISAMKLVIEGLKMLPKFIGLAILVYIVVGLGSLLLIIPGIYLGVVLSMSFYIAGVERISLFNAFGKAFKLMKGHWWETFGLYFVMVLIVAIGFYVFILIVGFFASEVLAAFNPMEFMNMEDVDLGATFVIGLTVLSIISTLISGFYLTAGLMQYFNLKAHAGGAVNQEINNIGTTE